MNEPKEHASLSLHELECEVHLGWPDNERRKKQTIRIDIDIYHFDPPTACETNELSDTTCYDAMIQSIQAFLDEREFKLIENLSKTLHQHIKQQFSKPVFVTVNIKKQLPNIKFKGVSFSYSG